MSIWEIVFRLLSTLGGIAAVIGAITSIKSAATARREVSSTAKKTDIEALDLVIANLRKGYDRLVKENADLRQTIAKLMDENEALRDRMAELEHLVGVWKKRYQQLCAWAVQRGLDPEEVNGENHD